MRMYPFYILIGPQVDTHALAIDHGVVLTFVVKIQPFFAKFQPFLVFSPNVGVLRGKCNMLLLIVITIFAFDIVDQ